MSGESTVVTHRVIEQRRTPEGEYQFLTQGDANNAPDAAYVREVQVRGTLWYAIPWLGWAAQLVTGDARAVIIPLVALALALYAVWMFVGWLRERRRRPAA